MSILIVGATRGLGAALTKQYARIGKTVYATTRSSQAPQSGGFPDNVKWLPSIDLTEEKAADSLVKPLQGTDPLDTAVRFPCGLKHFLPLW